MAEDLCTLLRIRHPIMLAPMAGGPSTPALAAAVSQAGGLGSLGAAYLAPDQIAAEAAQVRERTTAPFAVNLFARSGEAPPDGGDPTVERLLAAFRAELGLPPGPPRVPPPPSFADQFAAVLEARPAVFSFTFGLISAEQIRALRDRGIFIVGTATTVEEAVALEAAGVDAISVQGAEAGGHRGTFLGDFSDALIGTVALVPAVVRRVRIPVLAAGGIMDGRGIAAALALGAAGAQLGTAFLDCPEAGTAPAYRGALHSAAATRTVITAAFSGRPARGIRNRFTDAFTGLAVPPFPVQQGLTRDLRMEASRQGRTDLMQLWAGQGAPLIRRVPAADLVAGLVA